MPSLGADMEDGVLVEWLKKPGDAVAAGDVIAVIETQKGAIEIEVFEAGIVAELVAKPGSVLPVGSTMARLELEDSSGAKRTRQPLPQPEQPAWEPIPRAAMVAPARPHRLVSPAARRLAAEQGINLTTLGSGTGPGGALISSDVLTVASEASRKRAEKAAPDAMRQAIARTMVRSKREIPHYYADHEVDLTPAETWLTAHNADVEPAGRLLMAALFLKAVALAAVDYPEFNGSFQDGCFQPAAAVHLGVAINLRGGGLMAPAIHDTATLELPCLMEKLRDLTRRVRGGGIRGAELRDSTLTVSSLGDRGVDRLFPIIHAPQVAIVGIGRPTTKPWVIGREVVPRTVVSLSLAADHRVSDGHRGARFLASIAAALSDPEHL